VPVLSRAQHGPDRIFRFIALIASVGLIAFVVVVFTTRSPKSEPRTLPDPPPPMLKAGTEAPGFSVPRLGGGPPVELAAFRGTPVVLNFFASWCEDCQAELTAMASFWRSSTGRVDVVGVDTNDQDRAAADRLLRHAGAGYPVGLDPDAQVATRYLIEALPTTYFITAGGLVRSVAFGKLTIGDLDALTKELGTGRG